MRLNTTQLENILKNKIYSRNIIDDSKLHRIIERVELSNRNILIKYGSDADLAKEINIYEKILNNSEEYPVPQLLIGKEVDNIHFLAMEWIDGIHPDFKNIVHIESVFMALGQWAANWSREIESYSYLSKEALSNFNVLDNLLKNNKDSLIHILGNSLMDSLNHCIKESDKMIECLEELPLTLNPGDISLHNCIINSNEEVIFIDFESCTVSSMITIVEHLGEDYESIPHKQDDIYLALKSYLSAWNKFSNMSIEWEDFIHYQLYARIHYNIGNFNYWIERILKNKNLEETLGWIKRGEEKLQLLLSHGI